MVKIKILNSYSADRLELEANDWLACHRHSDIINIQYQANNDAYHAYTVCIAYRDGS
jgi:hypothetical protein